MTRSSSWRLGRGAAASLVLLAGLMLSGGQALAATQLSHSGHRGHYSFTDTVGSPGARCVYQGAAGSQNFDHARVKAPKVYWPTSGVPASSGTVGWRLKLQHWDGHEWDTVRTTSEVRNWATTTTPAPFSSRSVLWAAPHDRKYRVLVKIRWLTPDADPIGSATVRIDHYRRTYDDSVGSACKAVVHSF